MSLFAPTFHNLRDLYLNELRDLCSAENQLLGALPKMAEAASSPNLRRAFTSHLEETRLHAMRLEEIFQNLGETPTGETCAAMSRDGCAAFYLDALLGSPNLFSAHQLRFRLHPIGQ